MIPATIDPETASPGEHEVFRRLEHDPAASDWTVLHSLDLARPVRAVRGELDFLILVPGKGALALEVKACRTLARRDGLWFYGQQGAGDPRGPFKQASEAMHTVRSQLERHPDLRRTVFWSAVLFPYVRFEERSTEWHAWQAIDALAFAAAPLSALLETVLDHARAYLQSRTNTQWFSAAAAEPTKRQCDVIAQVLRPEFEVAVTPSDLRRHRELELKRFTEEQFAALDSMESNPRVVFEGAAGTGKTFLALEAARRASVKQERVLLLCFNAMLGDWLRRETASLAPHVTARTIHSYMLATSAARRPSGRDHDSEFWQTELPALALQQIVESLSFEPYDVLIVDEAQDILRNDYLDVLDLSVKGGLAAGAVRLFGDFERQAIFDASDVSVDDYCEIRGGRPARFRLSINCRNTPRIVELIKLLGRVPESYSRVLRPDTGSEPRLKFSATGEGQCELLAEALEELYDSGLTGSDIAVISPLAREACAERIGISPWPDRLAPAREAGAGQIPYATVHAFKGMEAAAVVVTDVANLSTKAMESLFYTAITRATDRLVILLDEGARDNLRTLLER